MAQDPVGSFDEASNVPVWDSSPTYDWEVQFALYGVSKLVMAEGIVL